MLPLKSGADSPKIITSTGGDMFAPPDEDVIAWLESDEVLRHNRVVVGPSIHRAMLSFLPLPDFWVDPASTTDDDLNDCRLDPFWNERV